MNSTFQFYDLFSHPIVQIFHKIFLSMSQIDVNGGGWRKKSIHREKKSSEFMISRYDIGSPPSFLQLGNFYTLQFFISLNAPGYRIDIHV